MAAANLPNVLNDLYLLNVISQSGSLSKAARCLGISKASVSDRLRSLERAVGMVLVRRSTRSLALTAAAAQLVEDTRSAFDRLDASFEQIKDLAGAPRGLLRVSAPVALGRQRIAPLIPVFLRQFPEIRVELDLSDRLVSLPQDGFDIAIRHTSSVPERYIAKLLAPSRALLMASAEYLARHGRPRVPSDLARHSCLLYLRDGQSQSWSFEREGERRPGALETIPVSGVFKANNSEVLREAILGHLGIGLLPDFSAQEDAKPRKLTQVLPDWRPVGFFGEKIFAIRLGGVRASRAAECLIEFLRRAFGHP